MKQLTGRCYLLKLKGPTDYLYKYITKQTNNMYRNKQTTDKAGFNPNSIKHFINIKTTFKNIFYNSIENITNLKICMIQATKQTTAKAGFNLYFIKNFSNMKTTFKNIFQL